MYPWKSVVQIDKQAGKPVYVQISSAIITEIKYGRIKAGDSLPGARSLSEFLDLNRKTVMIAYDELMAQGWVEIIPSKGVFVSMKLPLVNSKTITADTELNKSSQKSGFTVGENNVLNYKEYFNVKLLSIDDGSPDDRLAPIDLIWKKCRSINKSKIGRRLLSYQNLDGTDKLKTQLCSYLRNTRGLNSQSANLQITRGSQMAIYLIFEVLLKKGDKVIVGDSNYTVANQVIENTGASLVKVPVESDGISIESVKETCKKEKIRALYITPHHHFPTTVTLSAEKRLELLALAEKYRFAIVEDDYDYDFHYASAPILPLASADPHNLVIYIGSFSKLLAPSIRIGYVSGPKNFIRELTKLRRIVDRQGDPIMEHALAEMIEEGELQRHLKKAVKIYKARRDLFCNLLEEKLGRYVKFKIPEGGMTVWVKFDKKIDMHMLSQKLLSNGLYLETEKEFIMKNNAARLGFASLNEAEISRAMNILEKVVLEMVVSAQ